MNSITSFLSQLQEQEIQYALCEFIAEIVYFS